MPLRATANTSCRRSHPKKTKPLMNRSTKMHRAHGVPPSSASVRRCPAADVGCVDSPAWHHHAAEFLPAWKSLLYIGVLYHGYSDHSAVGAVFIRNRENQKLRPKNVACTITNCQEGDWQSPTERQEQPWKTADDQCKPEENDGGDDGMAMIPLQVCRADRLHAKQPSKSQNRISS